MKDMLVKLLGVTANIETCFALAHKLLAGCKSGKAGHRGSYSQLHVTDSGARHMLDEQMNE